VNQSLAVLVGQVLLQQHLKRFHPVLGQLAQGLAGLHQSGVLDALNLTAQRDALHHHRQVDVADDGVELRHRVDGDRRRYRHAMAATQFGEVVLVGQFSGQLRVHLREHEPFLHDGPPPGDEHSHLIGGADDQRPPTQSTTEVHQVVEQLRVSFAAIRLPEDLPLEIARLGDRRVRVTDDRVHRNARPSQAAEHS